MEIWDRLMLLHIASTIGVPKFIDNCIEKAIKGGYAKAYIQMDLQKPLRPEVDVMAKGR